MKLNRTLCIGLLSVTMLSGCSLFSGEDDVVKVSPLPKVENQFKPNKVWSTSVGSGVGDYHSHLRPDWMGERVYAADRKGLVKAMNANSGKEIWSVNLATKTGFLSSESALLSGGVLAANGKIFVGSERARVFALSQDDGATAWQTEVAGEVLSRPVLSEGLILSHTSNGQLQALSEANGSIQWTANLDMPLLSLRGESSPASAHGAAIIGGDNGRVSAVLLQQGQFIWQQRISQPKGSTEIDRLGDIDASPIIVDGLVYAMSYNGSIAALDLRSGQILWKRDMGSVSDFIIDGSSIYLVDQDDRVVALDINGGAIKWKQSDLLHRSLTAPVIYNGYVVVGDEEGYLHWLDSSTGNFIAQNKVDSDGLLSTPVVAGDKLLVQARGGKVYAYTR